MTHQTGREDRPGGADDAGVDEPDVGQSSREDLGQTTGNEENGARDAAAKPSGSPAGRSGPSARAQPAAKPPRHRVREKPPR